MPPESKDLRLLLSLLVLFFLTSLPTTAFRTTWTKSKSSIQPTNQPWTTAQSRAQFAALARLRWCIFRNAFRRKGGAGELVARIIIFPIFAALAIGPILGSGVTAFYLASTGRIAMLPLLTWGIFALWMLVVLNVSTPGLSFDINTIIRFPLSFPRYLTARIFFGLLSASDCHRHTLSHRR